MHRTALTPRPLAVIVATLGLSLAAGCTPMNEGWSPAASDASAPHTASTAGDFATAAQSGAPSPDLVRCEVVAAQGAAGINDCVVSFAGAPGAIVLAAGTYMVPEPVVIAHSGVQLLGAGPATVLRLSSGVNAPVIQIGDPSEDRDEARITDIVVRDMWIDGSGGDQEGEVVGDAPWISVAGLSARHVERLTVSGLFISDAAGAGVQLDDVSGAEVRSVTVNGAGFDGLSVAASDDVRVSSSRFEGNGGAGISLDWGVVGGAITDTVIKANGFSWGGGDNPGLYMAWTEGVAVHGTEIADNDGNGVILTNQGMADDPAHTCSSSNTFERTRITGNGQFGIWITHSTCADNAVRGVAYVSNGWGPVFEPVCGQLAEQASSCHGDGCPNACAQ